MSDNKLPVTKEGAEKDVYHSLLSNSLRLLSDEQRAGLIAALFVRSSNWDYIVSEINRTNEVEGRKIYVTGDKSLIEHSCDAPLKTCAAIEQWIERIIEGEAGFKVWEEREWVIHHVSREVTIASFVIRCLANTRCEGSDYVLSEIMKQRSQLLNNV